MGLNSSVLAPSRRRRNSREDARRVVASTAPLDIKDGTHDGVQVANDTKENLNLSGRDR